MVAALATMQENMSDHRLCGNNSNNHVSSNIQAMAKGMGMMTREEPHP
jgi:hypothetical protein